MRAVATFDGRYIYTDVREATQLGQFRIIKSVSLSTRRLKAMGMDLYALAPEDPEFSEFSASWVGWGVLSDLLIELGCEMSVSNDGDLVSELTATNWGRAIEENLDRIVEVRYHDESFAAGFRSELRVIGSKTPVLLTRHEISRVVMAETMGVTNEDRYANDEVPFVLPILELKESLNWLLRAAWFFRNSGGFAQL